jgi:hypothetical protein
MRCSQQQKDICNKEIRKVQKLKEIRLKTYEGAMEYIH